MMHSGLKLLAAGLPEVLPSRAAPDSRWGYPTAERVVGLLRAGGGTALLRSRGKASGDVGGRSIVFRWPKDQAHRSAR
jgi:hypothetical protein